MVGNNIFIGFLDIFFSFDRLGCFIHECFSRNFRFVIRPGLGNPCIGESVLAAIQSKRISINPLFVLQVPLFQETASNWYQKDFGKHIKLPHLSAFIQKTEKIDCCLTESIVFTIPIVCTIPIVWSSFTTQIQVLHHLRLSLSNIWRKILVVQDLSLAENFPKTRKN